jgi:hypothetical protein
MSGKKLKRAGHHYWPESLSQYWANSEGQTIRLAWNGEEVRSPPKNFGVLGDGHRVKVDGPWDSTIEPLFQNADSNFPGVVEYLSRLEANTASARAEWDKRLLAQPLPTDIRAQLGECLASLIARSPAFRNSMKIAADYYRDGLPYRDKQDEKNLIVLNINQHYGQMVNVLKGGGKLVVLFSDSAEFIFSEGFLSNIDGTFGSGGKCFVPLTPSMGVGFSAPGSYWTNPNNVTIRLSQAEVELCNEISQVYTQDYVYYRGQRPKIIPAFERREFLHFEYHQHKWFDALFAAVANFRPKR